MSKIEITTDANGCEMILLTDEPRFGSGARGLPAQHILVRACDGRLFSARPGLPGLQPLSDVEEEMAQHYFNETGGPADVVSSK